MWNAKNVQNAIGTVIEFTEKAEDLECYPEKGMKAKIVDVCFDHGISTPDDPLRDQVWIVTVDYSDFETHNKPFESFNYYDKNGVPRLNAREAGFYKRKDELFLPAPELWSEYFVPIEKMDKISGYVAVVYLDGVMKNWAFFNEESDTICLDIGDTLESYFEFHSEAYHLPAAVEEARANGLDVSYKVKPFEVEV